MPSLWAQEARPPQPGGQAPSSVTSRHGMGKRKTDVDPEDGERAEPLLQGEEGREERDEGNLEEDRREPAEPQRPLASRCARSLTEVSSWVGRQVGVDWPHGTPGPFLKVSWGLPPEATSLQWGPPWPTSPWTAFSP